ncbi:MAG: OmpA family protein [Rhodospirillaceae bacterium]|jgi:flagellar motor protein MotB|nr:OmpA family protein [Rhodospirillaceae bacterium]
MPTKTFKITVSRGTSLVAAGLLLSACSQVPDAANPVEWYNNTVEFFSGDEQAGQDQAAAKGQTAEAKARTLPADNSQSASQAQAFPKLNTVDRQAEYEAARKKGGLVADVEGRKYAPAIARQGEPSTRLAEAPPEPPKAGASAAAQPAPNAMPKTPVISSTDLAAVPAAGSSAGGLPTTAEQQAFEARLRKQLAEIKARAGQPGPSLLRTDSTVIASLAPDQFGTVVISSSGIESGTQSAAMATEPMINTGGGVSYLERQPRALASGATRIATIQFPNGSANLSSNDRKILASVRQLQRERGGRIHIIGHASSRTRTMDPVRHKMVNFKVSVERANVVARELMRMGFKKDELLVDAVSDTEPEFYEFMPSGEAGNRRAEIYLEG